MEFASQVAHQVVHMTQIVIYAVTKIAQSVIHLSVLNALNQICIKIHKISNNVFQVKTLIAQQLISKMANVLLAKMAISQIKINNYALTLFCSAKLMILKIIKNVLYATMDIIQQIIILAVVYKIALFAILIIFLSAHNVKVNTFLIKITIVYLTAQCSIVRVVYKIINNNVQLAYLHTKLIQKLICVYLIAQLIIVKNV
ncbi:transmembrane protein, putative (macronuclear) [Tetrahymena thermophila SB210]|uniref:Transmembrane protein, putative n=1 Tax=Tetrahymena thermophila (strain SB210) TaxID=312017 RepID=W7X7H0_TETTS|nr:transmembrane protein, putative [Tetrahymena thermophila SB210]EWS75315.1 transmembrane protein, putative [Tetrahymena thermophila SB210]|eukprot:XP_012652147.1 transmembrane protein, putative [Tetrahymena thermophila SB210]